MSGGGETAEIGTGRLVVHGAVAVAVCGVAVVVHDGSDWHPVWLFGLLAVMAVTAEAAAVRVGRIRFAGSDLSMVLAVFLLGPLPALAIAFVAAGADALLRRLHPARLLMNASVLAFTVALASTVAEVGAHLDWTDPLGASLPALVLVTAIAMDFSNFALVASTSPPLRGVPFRVPLRDTWMPLFPWAATAGALAAAAVHAYHSPGPGRSWRSRSSRASCRRCCEASNWQALASGISGGWSVRGIVTPVRSCMPNGGSAPVWRPSCTTMLFRPCLRHGRTSPRRGVASRSFS